MSMYSVREIYSAKIRDELGREHRLTSFKSIAGGLKSFGVVWGSLIGKPGEFSFEDRRFYEAVNCRWALPMDSGILNTEFERVLFYV